MKARNAQCYPSPVRNQNARCWFVHQKLFFVAQPETGSFCVRADVEWCASVEEGGPSISAGDVVFCPTPPVQK